MMENKKMRLCICGGGGLGHTIAGIVGENQQYEVNILTGKPQQWKKEIQVLDCNNKTIKATLHKISSDPQDVIPQSDVVLFCLPGFMMEETLTKIKPYLTSSHRVGTVVSSTGFFLQAFKILPSNVGLFGFLRVPFIARVNEYGKSAFLLGYKNKLQLATKNINQETEFLTLLASAFQTPIEKYRNFWEVTLSNSNPILHPARLYSLFKDYDRKQTYTKHFLFYEEWDDESSDLLIQCDNEFQQIVEKLPIRNHIIPPILEYYESFDPPSLTRKIRSIKAFKGLKAPMIQKDNTFIPDFNNRYFTEDFPYGLVILKSIAENVGVATPTIDKILLWGQRMMNKEYLKNSLLIGKDIQSTAYVSRDEFSNIIHT